MQTHQQPSNGVSVTAQRQFDLVKKSKNGRVFSVTEDLVMELRNFNNQALALLYTAGAKEDVSPCRFVVTTFAGPLRVVLRNHRIVCRFDRPVFGSRSLPADVPLSINGEMSWFGEDAILSFGKFLGSILK